MDFSNCTNCGLLIFNFRLNSHIEECLKFNNFDIDFSLEKT